MGSEKFCLRWNDFENNISLAFRELRDDKDFFDVTLACDDEQIQAHKVILSACSPFFRNILRRNPHQNPLLYLKGVKYTDLQSVLNFMYHGEVNVAQEELNSFLAVAEDLRVKGLTQNQSGNQQRTKQENVAQNKSPIIKSTIRPPDREYHPAPPPVKRQRPAQSSLPSDNSSHHVEDDDIQEVVPVKSEPRDVPITDPVPQHLPPPPAASQSMFTPTQPHTNILAQEDDQALAYPDDNYDDYGQYADEQEYQGDMSAQPIPTGVEGTEGACRDPSDLLQFVVENPGGIKKYRCALCETFSHNGRSHVRNHVESVHYPNSFSYPCGQCDKSFPSKSNVTLHRSRAHKQKINPFL